MRKLVAAVIYNGEKYLILRRKLNWKGWEFVKGEAREGLKNAILREIREETGIRDAKIRLKLPAEVIYSHEDIRGHTTSMQVAFLAETNKKKVRLSLEHSRFRWVTAKQGMKLLKHQTHKTFLKLADDFLRKKWVEERKKLIEKLSKKHVTLVRFDGKRISLKYDGVMLKNKAIKKAVRVVGDWSRKRNEVYYDRNLTNSVMPILVHETVERHVALKYGLDVDTEAHRIAQAVEKEFVADKRWRAVGQEVARAWVKANHERIWKSKFY